MSYLKNTNYRTVPGSMHDSMMHDIGADNDDGEDSYDDNSEDDEYSTSDIEKKVVSDISLQDSLVHSCYDTSSTSFVQNFENTSFVHKKRYRHVHCTDTRDNDVRNSSYSKYILLILIVISAVLCGGYMQSSNENNRDKLSDEQILSVLKESVIKIQVQFPNQEDKIWKAFLSQVEEVIKDSTQVSTVILLSNETNTMNCLAQLLGEVSSIALGSNNYLTLKAMNAKNDHGSVVQWLRVEVENKRVAVIEDLQNMSSTIVKALHYLCDKENPLVVKSVYIITITSDGYEGIQEDRFIESYLRKRLSSAIEEDVLDPLIARIMDGPILRILPEVTARTNFNSRKCSLN